MDDNHMKENEQIETTLPVQDGKYGRILLPPDYPFGHASCIYEGIWYLEIFLIV